MPDFAALIESIREAGRSAGSAADQARGLAPDTALTGLHEGIPGAAALGKLGAVRERWAGSGASWAGNMDDYAQGLTGAADRYAANEDAARRDLGDPAHTSGGARPI